MKTVNRHHSAWALLLAFAAAACGEGGLDPLSQNLAIDEAAELAVLEDVGSFEAAIDLSTVTTDVATELGMAGSGEGRLLTAQSATRFNLARGFLLDGNRRRALEEAREARRIAARAIVATGGEDAVLALIEHLEELAHSIDPEDDDVFDDPEALAQKLEALAARARELMEAGHTVAAAERALLGEQLVRYHRGRRGHRGDVLEATARLAVSVAGTSVALADSLVADDTTPVRQLAADVRTHQNRWLTHAHRMLERAQVALDAGYYARAVHFAHHAHWSALKAVILPGGITQEELDAMVELATVLFAEAEVAVGDDPTSLQARLLAIAGRSIERGVAMLEDGKKRGVGAVWRGAVISRWLVG
ncbi:MAG: HEPN domain-containing protein [Gemmatimonadota bacterium]